MYKVQSNKDTGGGITSRIGNTGSLRRKNAKVLRSAGSGPLNPSYWLQAGPATPLVATWLPSGEHSSSSQLPSRSCSSKGTAGAPFCRKPDYSSPSKLQRCPSRFWAAVHPGEAFSDLGTHPQLDCKDLEGRQTSSLLVPPFSLWGLSIQ